MYKIINDDAKNILPFLDEESIDLVFTDPPYPKEYIHCFQYLADYCPRLMKNGASLVTLLGHYQLEEVISIFKGKLKFRWLLHLSQFESNRSRMAMGIEVTFKPMLWYVKKAYPQGRGFLRDGIAIKRDKSLHVWQQPVEWCEYYISKLTKEGDTVLDPFAGSGTVPYVCNKLNRNCIAIEKDIDAYNIMRERILGDTMNV